MPTITDCHFLPPGVEKDSEVTLGFNGKEFHELLVTGHGQVRESGGTHRGSISWDCLGQKIVSYPLFPWLLCHLRNLLFPMRKEITTDIDYDEK